METNQFTPDKWTQNLIELLLDISKSATKENKKYYIGGGFSIYLTLGKILRNHEDIDFYPDEKDKDWWKNWFSKKGYKIKRGEWMENYPDAYYLTNDKNEYFADIYPIRIFDNGNIGMLNKNGNYGVWDGKSWFDIKKVFYNKIPIFIENPKSVVDQKLEWSKRNNKPLSRKHLSDIDVYKNFLQDKESCQKKPLQYLLIGLPFSGKTTLANILTTRLEFKNVNIDEIKKEYGYEAMDDDYVPGDVWEKIFNEINKRVIKYLKNGLNVLTETAWVKKEWRDKARIMPSKEGFKTKVIYVVCTPETARKRLQENRQTKKRFDVPNNIFEESIRDFEVPTKDEDVILYDQPESLDEWIKFNFI